MVTLRVAVAWGLGLSGVGTGWPTAIGAGVLIAALVYRMGRERLLPLEENRASRAIFSVYKPALRWVLTHKGTFLLIPSALVLMGITAWLGFERLATPLSITLQTVGVEPTRWSAWQRLDKTFPGIGREFMPPLDEGSFLYMPSLLPSASLTQVQEVLARQNLALQTVPEVEDVVGKAGRAESAVDPAPNPAVD